MGSGEVAMAMALGFNGSPVAVLCLDKTHNRHGNRIRAPLLKSRELGGFCQNSLFPLVPIGGTE